MPKPVRLSLYKRHVAKWKGGCGSSFCCTARNKVFARGVVPADVLFIGEAPGKSEDRMGSPFQGPAGILLDEIIESAAAACTRVEIRDDGETEHLVDPFKRRAFYNLVGCIPQEEGQDKEGAPPKEQILQCRPRLVEFVRLCRPRLIVSVGELSKKHAGDPKLYDPVDWIPEGGKPLKFCHIIHPAAIIRMNMANQGLMAERCVSILATAMDDL